MNNLGTARGTIPLLPYEYIAPRMEPFLFQQLSRCNILDQVPTFDSSLSPEPTANPTTPTPEPSSIPSPETTSESS